MSLGPQEQERLHRVLQIQGKIEAIRLLRELTGVGLKEGKDVIDSLAAGDRGPVSRLAARDIGSSTPLPLSNEIAERLNRGDKIGAIKVYRELHGVDMFTAKNAIEAMKAGKTARGGSFVVGTDPAVKASRGCLSLVALPTAALLFLLLLP